MAVNWDYLGDLGMGLLANGGVSDVPRTFGQGLGKAAIYAGEQKGVREDRNWTNLQRSMSLQEVARKQQQEQQAAERFEAAVQSLPPQLQAQARVVGPSFFTPKELGQGAQLVSPAGTIASVPPKPDDPKIETFAEGEGKAGKYQVFPDGTTRRIGDAQPSAALVNINNGPPITEERKQYEKDLAAARTAINKAGMAARGQLAKLNRMEQLLDSGLQTGALAPARKELSGIAASLGINIDPKLSDAEAFEAIANEVTLSLKSAGGENSMPGAMSNSDREFLSAMSPNLSKTPQGNKLVISAMKKLAERAIKLESMARDWVKKNGTMDGFNEYASEFAEQNPLFADFDVPVAPAATPAGQIKFLGFE